jgi:hypothetical protein
MTTRVASSVLANTAVTPGTYGGATTIAVPVVDQQGRITSLSNVSPLFTSSQLISPLTNLSLANTTISNVYETVNVWSSGANNTINFDILNQAVIYSTANATGNWTLNFRGNSAVSLNNTLPIGESTTVAFFSTQGTTAFYSTTANIDGISQTIKWLGGSAPTSGDVSSVDVYTYSIIKTGSSTFSIFGSQAQFK